MSMKKALLRLWYYLPGWIQRLATAIIRPRYQVAVGGVIFNERGQLLLCEHTYRRNYPWGLPGGDLKPGESPSDGIRRELKEETGLAVKEARLVMIENSPRIYHISLIYHCNGVSGSFIPNDEVASMRYFNTDRLPAFFPTEEVIINKALQIIKNEAT